VEIDSGHRSTTAVPDQSAGKGGIIDGEDIEVERLTHYMFVNASESVDVFAGGTEYRYVRADFERTVTRKQYRWPGLTYAAASAHLANFTAAGASPYTDRTEYEGIQIENLGDGQWQVTATHIDRTTYQLTSNGYEEVSFSTTTA